MHSEELETCQKKLGYRFTDPGLLSLALTHSSAKSSEHPSNERLEFLGDAVLGMIISDALYHRFRGASEGYLTRIKSVVVSSKTLGYCTKRLGLDEHIVVGKGIAAKKDFPQSLLGNVFEALVAAIYLDGGVEAARKFSVSNLKDEIDKVLSNKHVKNYKSLLQHHVQRVYGSVPTYQVLDESGPDHNKSFRVAAIIEGTTRGTSWGDNKKEAEQKAARETLSLLKSERAVESGTSQDRTTVDSDLESGEPD